MSNTTSLVIKIFVGVFGLGAIVWGIGAVQSNSSNWPSVQAKIVSSMRKSSSSRDYTTSYDVTYEYQVDNLRHSDSFTSDTDKYHPGEEITVYYDPSSPGSSITSRGEMEFYGIIGILFGLFCVGGIGWEAFKARAANRRPPAATRQDTNSDQG